MKFEIIEEDKGCRIINPNTLSEIVYKMYDIKDNLLFLLYELKEQYNRDDLIYHKSNLDLAILAESAQKISLDVENADDEFWIAFPNERFLSLEVVSEQVAILNDKDFLSGEVDLSRYELGGDLSCYSKLNDSKYYFRFI